jgi:hypothetical protein
VHNRAPQDGRYLEVHREVCAKLALLADQIHLHSSARSRRSKRDRPLARAEVTAIPHGNYRPVYPNPGQVERGGDEDERHLLLFGRLGRYKGGQELVQSFARLDGAPGSRSPAS